MPKKNFRLFNGVPLYKHTLYKLKDFEVYVDSDSEEILKQIKEDENLSQGLSGEVDNQGGERNVAGLEEAVAKVESFLTVQDRDLTFSIDENTNRSVVTVKDSQSGDVIRQIPSEELLKLAERIQELQQDVGNSVGVFINNQV